MIRQGILSAIGNTPLVQLTRVFDGTFNAYAKLEGMNPGGSIKDRPALETLQQMYQNGKIGHDTVVVEASSGNMGVGLAQICRYLGLRFICVTDPRALPHNIRLMQAYGAEVEVVERPDPATGDFLQARINRAKEMSESLPNAFWVNQYSNVYNARAHHRTMQEVIAALKGEVDYVFCSASSCGTLRGCSEYIRSHSPGTKLYAVDSPGSVIFGGTRGKRLIPGHGSGIRPELYREGLADACVTVTDLECVAGCRRLLAREALLVGGSSGGVFMAVEHVKREIPKGANCVMLLPDRGDRYLDTVFSDAWVLAQFGCSALDLESGEADLSVAVAGSEKS